MSLIRATFNRLGLMIEQKLTLMPAQRVEFFRAVLDSGQARASLPEACFLALCGIMEDLKHYSQTTSWNCLKLLGHMEACTYVIWCARLCLRLLQAWLASVYHSACGNIDMVVSFPLSVLET